MMVGRSHLASWNANFVEVTMLPQMYRPSRDFEVSELLM